MLELTYFFRNNASLDTSLTALGNNFIEVAIIAKTGLFRTSRLFLKRDSCTALLQNPTTHVAFYDWYYIFQGGFVSICLTKNV